MFPDVILEHLAYILAPQDLFHLSLTCKTFHSIYLNTAVWKSKAIADFGDPFHVYDLVTTCTELTLDPFLTETFQQEPADWCRYYIYKNTSINDMENDEELIYEADKEYTAAYNQLKGFERSRDRTAMSEAASKMIRMIDVFPGHAGCYYILGFILYVLNQLEEAIILLQVGQKADNSFRPIKELARIIQHLLKGHQTKANVPRLLANDHTLSASLSKVLLDMFAQFDQDKDGVLNGQEFDGFIYCTKGSHFPSPFLRQMAHRFGSDTHGQLTKNGFFAFYLEQTLDDPSKTRNDINVCGFDSHSLEPRHKMLYDRM